MSTRPASIESATVRLLEQLFLKPHRVELLAGTWAASGCLVAVWAALSSGNDPYAPLLLGGYDARVLLISASTFVLIALWLALAGWKSKPPHRVGFILSAVLMLVVPIMMGSWLSIVNQERLREAGTAASLAGPSAFFGSVLFILGAVVFLFRFAWLLVYGYYSSGKHKPAEPDKDPYLYPPLGHLKNLGLPHSDR